MCEHLFALLSRLAAKTVRMLQRNTALTNTDDYTKLSGYWRFSINSTNHDKPSTNFKSLRHRSQRNVVEFMNNEEEPPRERGPDCNPFGVQKGRTPITCCDGVALHPSLAA